MPSECPLSTDLPIPNLITRAFDAFVADLLHHLETTGVTGVRMTHVMNVFLYMDVAGTRPSEIARRAGMTAQAMGELITHLERLGYVERIPDPADGRGKLVVYSPRGLVIAEDVQRYCADVESRWAEIIGPERMSALKEDLVRIVGANEGA